LLQTEQILCITEKVSINGGTFVSSKRASGTSVSKPVICSS